MSDPLDFLLSWVSTTEIENSSKKLHRSVTKKDFFIRKFRESGEW